MTSLLPFQWHVAEIAVVVAAAVAHRLVVTDARLRRRVLYALAALLAVTLWPVGDLASSVFGREVLTVDFTVEDDDARTLVVDGELAARRRDALDAWSVA